MECLASSHFLLEMTGFCQRGLEAGTRDGAGWFSVTHPRRASSLSANLAISRGFLNSCAMSLAFLKNSRAVVGCANGHKFFPSHQGGSPPLSLKWGWQCGQLWPVGYEQNDAGQSLVVLARRGLLSLSLLGSL